MKHNFQEYIPVCLISFVISSFIVLCLWIMNDKQNEIQKLRDEKVEYKIEMLNKEKYYSKIKNEISVASISDNTYYVKTSLWIYDENNNIVSLEAREFNVVKESEVDNEQRRQIIFIQKKQQEVDKILEERYNKK